MIHGTIGGVSTRWRVPTDVRFGVGTISQLADACGELGISRPMLVTDPGLAAMDVVVQTLRALESAGRAVYLFDKVRPNPGFLSVAEGVAEYHLEECDGVIAFGGGSSLDTAKAISLMVGQNEPMWTYRGTGEGWRRANRAGIAPMIAVPTTSGTGSEVGPYAVIEDDFGAKGSIYHPMLMPRIVILDPNLAVGMPVKLTATTGMDALSHCLEAYASVGFDPACDALAVDGAVICARWLERAVADGTDIEARSWMMVASALGGMSFNKGLGAMHAMAHPLGATYDHHHGLLNAVVMPYVLGRNRVAVEARMSHLADLMEVEGGYDGLIRYVQELRGRLDIPDTLRELEVPEGDLPKLAAEAVKDQCAGGNPVPITDAFANDLFRDAHQGRVFGKAA